MAPEAEVIEALHAASVIRRVTLSTLRVDRSYQRDPSQRMVEEIARNWDEVSSELLLVSDRGPRTPEEMGGLFIVNGQHRTLAATKQGISSMDARIIDLMRVEDPAAIEALFRLRTNVRMSDKPVERFKAQLRSGNEESLAIVSILERFDTELNENPSQEAGINAVSALERLFRVDGTGMVMTETLQLLKDSFGRVGGKITSSGMLSGTAWFILKHSDETDRSRVVEKFNEAGLPVIDRRARTHQSALGGTYWLNVYRALVEIYNERLTDRSRLEWRTRGTTSFKGGGGAWGKQTG